MDFRMRAALRPLLATAAAALLATACAGASAAQDADGAPRDAYQGPMLSWAGKTQPRAAQPAPQRAAVAEAAPPRYAAPPYVAPAPESAPPPRAAREEPESAAREMAAESAPPTPADARPVPPGYTGVRFYSVDRAYGLTPDPIRMPTQRPMVLVGPPDRYADPGQDDAGADDNAGKPAQHDGQGADGAGAQSGQD